MAKLYNRSVRLRTTTRDRENWELLNISIPGVRKLVFIGKGGLVSVIYEQFSNTMLRHRSYSY